MIHKQQLDQMMGKSLPHSFWIIDTGASHHVTGDATSLTNIRSILPCPVDLPKGQQVVATQEGQVVLSPHLTLDRVLFVPSLQCHLISVSQLTKVNGCVVKFTNALCAIQDQHLGSLIGAGEQQGGLYYFRGIPTVCAVATVPSFSTFELWHRWLGHPSDRVLKLVPVIKDNPSVSSKKLPHACTVYPQAKHTRDSFPLSNNKLKLVIVLNLFIVICGDLIIIF